MVTRKRKWQCGRGHVILFYCDVCGECYDKVRKARGCEESHMVVSG